MLLYNATASPVFLTVCRRVQWVHVHLVHLLAVVLLLRRIPCTRRPGRFLALLTEQFPCAVEERQDLRWNLVRSNVRLGGARKAQLAEDLPADRLDPHALHQVHVDGRAGGDAQVWSGAAQQEQYKANGWESDAHD